MPLLKTKPSKPSTNGKTPPEVIWYADATEQPRQGGVDANRLANKQRRNRLAIRIMMASTVFTAFGILGLLAKNPKSPAAGGGSTSPGKVQAWGELQQWLAQNPSPLPGGQIVSWDGARLLPGKSKPQIGAGTAAKTPPYQVELDTFTVQGNNTTYTATVDVAVSPQGATALSGPSLAAVATPPKASTYGNGPWPGIVAGDTAPGNVSQEIGQWADAYTSGDPEKLTLAVGDPNSAHHYTPISGVSAVATQVTWVAPFGASNDQMLVEAQLKIQWDGQPPPDSGEPTNQNGSSANQYAPLTTVDLLVQQAHSSAPKVVAWGPPGSGPTLAPYQNGK